MSASVILAALGAVILWGASPVATKIAVIGMPVLMVAVLRTVIGGIAAIPIALVMGTPLPKTPAERTVLLTSAFCGFVAFPLLYTIGLKQTSANHASLILAVLPIYTGAIAFALERRWPPLLWWSGCAIALAGETLLITSREGAATHGASLEGDAIVLGSAVFASAGYVAGARLKQMGYPSTGATFWGAASMSVLLLASVPFIVRDVDLLAIPLDAWLALLYQAVAVTILGYILWYWALGKGGIARMGLFQFLQPVSGVLLAALLLSEPLTATLLLSAALILGGVFLASR